MPATSGGAIGQGIGEATSGGGNNGRGGGGGGDRDSRDAFGGLDIGVSIGRDRSRDASSIKKVRGIGGKVSTKDSLTDNGAEVQPPEPEDAATKLAKALRRGRRASILASSGNQGLGSTAVTRPGGRRAKVLLG